MDARTGFIQSINSLIREVTVSNVAACQLDTCFQRFIRISHIMMVFVLLFNILQYLERFLSSGRFNNHFLETAFQSTVFFYILPVFIKGSGTYTLYFTTCQCRFQHIGSIHRTGSCSGTHNRVNLVNKQNYIRILLQLINDRTNTFLKLSAILGSGYYRSHIKHYHTFIKQNTGYFLLNNT